jgi:hypothetical protein
MAKTDIILNNKTFPIGEEIIDEATEKLHSYLTTKINGTGEKVKIGSTTYNVDATKLAATKGEITSYLNTIAGVGEKIIVNNIEHNVDINKVNYVTF